MSITLAGWNDPEKRARITELEGELRYYTQKWIENNHITWVNKNIGFLTEIYDQTKRPEKTLELLEEMFSYTEPYEEAHRAVYTTAYGYFMRKGEYEKAEEVTREMAEWEQDTQETRALLKKLSFILKKLGKTEESKEILARIKTDY